MDPFYDSLLESSAASQQALLDAIAKCESKKDLGLIMPPARFFLTDRLDIVMMLWRERDPRCPEMVASTLKEIKQVIPHYKKMSRKDRCGQPVDFGLAALLSRLIQDEFDPDFVELVTTPDDFPDLRNVLLLPFINSCILFCFRDGKMPAAFEDIISLIVRRSKGKEVLFSRTLRCYADLAAAVLAEDWERAGPLVELACENYTKRRKDRDYKQFLIEEAGGKFNDLFVDYRLGVILHLGFARRPDWRGIISNPHVWPF